MEEHEGSRRVCVTGAGGYVGSWLVKLLLCKGYLVHGTVRDPSDERNVHLKKLEKATENLQLFKADLLNYNSLREAIEGCHGVFHVASPVPTSSVLNIEIELVEVAIAGTLNVLKASSVVGVKRVVVVSSRAAVCMHPNWANNQVQDETSWSDTEYCKLHKKWYCLAKTVAESEALEYAKRTGLDVVTVCPSLAFGPMLQTKMNGSSLVLFKILKDGLDTLENKVQMIVDVRDVAEALVLAFEKPEAEGRYICVPHMIRTLDLVNKLRSLYPNYNYPKNFTEVVADEKMSSEKLKSLGWKYRPLEDTLVDSVKNYQEVGLLDKD